MRLLSAALALSLAACASMPGAERDMPRLERRGAATQLIVDGAPYLILGGELGNSTASNLNYLRPYWDDFQDMHLNTVLAPVSWELIEPVEGQFDFASVDGLLRDARAHDMRLVILWFGAWKNSMSSYTPAWVKRDEARFPRARDANGRAQEILSPFYEANAEADARAFAALMAHLRVADPQRTVLMVQVENEIGMLPSARDHSEAANAAWNAPVPPEMLEASPARRETAPGRTWAQAYGYDAAAEERFMAWYFARYTERVTAAGKAEYPLPMFVNAALPRPGAAPGSQYPSAGPIAHLFAEWNGGAPSLDFLAPDIYFPNFVEWMQLYALPDNPLFIPEANRAGRAESGADAFFVFGELDAMGYSPFSIEDAEGEGRESLTGAYATLESLTPLILEHQSAGTISGVRAPVAFDGSVDDRPQDFSFGAYRFRVTMIDPWTPRADQNIAAHGGLMMQVGPDEFIVAGSGITITFAPLDGAGSVGIESAWEGAYVDGAWKPGRLLNGDQTHQGRHIRLPPGAWGVQRVWLYRYR